MQKDRGLYRSDRRTGENGHHKSSSEPGRRKPSGTARSNYTHAFETHLSHAASSVIISPSLALAALAQPCHFGIWIVFPFT